MSSEPLTVEVFARLLGTSGRVPVYHYTSATGLLGIIQSSKLWATDVRFLNDSREFSYTLDLIAPEIEAFRRGDRPGGEGAATMLEEAVGVVRSLAVYAASFSDSPDRLSQWRGYCPPGAGFAIGFEPEHLMGVTGCLLVPCVYATQQQRELVEFLLTEGVRRLETYEGDDDPIPARLRAGADFAGGLIVLAASLKSPGFSEEGEWRLVTRSEPGGTLPALYRTGTSGLVPYIELSLVQGESSLTLESLTIGPNPHPELATRAVEKLLSDCTVECERIRPSGVALRSW